MSANVVTSLSITNPLVKYRALVATKQVLPDPSQLRLALHLQKLYDRLKDYEPQIEYSTRLDQIARAVGNRDGRAIESESVPARQSAWRSLFAAKERRDSLALTRKLTSHESALELTSPKGLMLHGEVGTGKSMLVDLFADCLPNRKKRRLHFNTFMLETFAKLESLRRSRITPPAFMGDGSQDDYSLLWLAKDMIQTSPILFLDEFQMPDRVASKILTNLMTSFFHLGGVLVATSNRMPEELAKASGIEFTPPPSRMESLGWIRKRKSSSDKLFGGKNEFVAFLEVLKARCEVWEMEGGKDYRRLESGTVTPVAEIAEEWQLDGHDDMQHSAGMPGWSTEGRRASETVAKDEPAESAPAKLPTFFSTGSTEEDTLPAAFLQSTGENLNPSDTPWTTAVMKVYGRAITVPRSYAGVTMWTFEELCMSTLGPADYITLASNYHTVILQKVPVLTWLMKNEARRFITLLDALYECKCKLFISAAAGPDDLFFPEEQGKSNGDSTGDSVYSETISDIYQDATAPFRPNILSDNPNYAEPDPEPNYTHARLVGLLNADALEDDPPNKPRPGGAFGRSFGRTDAELMERAPIDPDEIKYTAQRGPDFGKTASFTGEDERFAYKRAQSRMWEMCGSRWWARNEEGWHRPLPLEVRRWERAVGEDLPPSALQRKVAEETLANADAKMGDSTVDETRDERSFRHASASSFRTSTEPPPKFSWTHVWGTTKWGPKAGAWGQGPEGLKDRGNEKR